MDSSSGRGSARRRGRAVPPPARPGAAPLPGPRGSARRRRRCAPDLDRAAPPPAQLGAAPPRPAQHLIRASPASACPPRRSASPAAAPRPRARTPGRRPSVDAPPARSPTHFHKRRGPFLGRRSASGARRARARAGPRGASARRACLVPTTHRAPWRRGRLPVRLSGARPRRGALKRRARALLMNRPRARRRPPGR